MEQDAGKKDSKMTTEAEDQQQNEVDASYLPSSSKNIPVINKERLKTEHDDQDKDAVPDDVDSQIVETARNLISQTLRTAHRVCNVRKTTIMPSFKDVIIPDMSDDDDDNEDEADKMLVETAKSIINHTVATAMDMIKHRPSVAAPLIMFTDPNHRTSVPYLSGIDLLRKSSNSLEPAQWLQKSDDSSPEIVSVKSGSEDKLSELSHGIVSAVYDQVHENIRNSVDGDLRERDNSEVNNAISRSFVMIRASWSDDSMTCIEPEVIHESQLSITSQGVSPNALEDDIQGSRDLLQHLVASQLSPTGSPGASGTRPPPSRPSSEVFTSDEDIFLGITGLHSTDQAAQDVPVLQTQTPAKLTDQTDQDVPVLQTQTPAKLTDQTDQDVPVLQTQTPGKLADQTDQDVPVLQTQTPVKLTDQTDQDVPVLQTQTPGKLTEETDQDVPVLQTQTPGELTDQNAKDACPMQTREPGELSDQDTQAKRCVLSHNSPSNKTTPDKSGHQTGAHPGTTGKAAPYSRSPSDVAAMGRPQQDHYLDSRTRVSDRSLSFLPDIDVSQRSTTSMHSTSDKFTKHIRPAPFRPYCSRSEYSSIPTDWHLPRLSRHHRLPGERAKMYKDKDKRPIHKHVTCPPAPKWPLSRLMTNSHFKLHKYYNEYSCAWAVVSGKKKVTAAG